MNILRSKKIAFSLIVLIVVCLTSCKSTPSKTYVVNKADGKLEKIISASPAPLGGYVVPDSWKDSVTSESGKIQIHVDAKIITPDVQSCPVIRISPADITQEQADLFIKVLMKGNSIYIPKTEDDITKQELSDRIVSLEKIIADPKSDLNLAKTSDPNGYNDALALYKEQIKQYQDKIKTAPDVYVRKPATGKFITPSTDNINQKTSGDDWSSLKSYMSGLKVINIEADLGKSKPSTLYILKNQSLKQNELSFDNYEKPQKNTAIFENNDDLPGQKITLRKAMDTANELLSNLGIDYLRPVFLAAKPDRSGDPNYLVALKDLPRFYRFFYTREVSGIPTTYVNNNLFTMGDVKYTEDWPEELVTIDVDDTGVLAWNWRAPSTVLKTENSNVSMLPFSDIQEKLKQQLLISGAWEKENGVVLRQIFIEKITLGMARIQSRNNDNEYLLVPAWDFFGYSIIQYAKGQGDPANQNEKHEETERTIGHSYLTINAIDGSIIYR